MRRRKRGFPWWLLIILLANLIVHLIPEEWIVGPAPSVDSVSQQGIYAVRPAED